MAHTLSAAKYLVSTYKKAVIGKEFEKNGVKYIVDHLVIIPHDEHDTIKLKLTINYYLDNGFDNEEALKKVESDFRTTFSEYDVYVVCSKDVLRLNLKWEIFAANLFP